MYRAKALLDARPKRIVIIVARNPMKVIDVVIKIPAIASDLLYRAKVRSGHLKTAILYRPYAIGPLNNVAKQSKIVKIISCKCVGLLMVIHLLRKNVVALDGFSDLSEYILI